MPSIKGGKIANRPGALLAIGFVTVIVAGGVINIIDAKWLDFVSFWAAAQMLGADAYDVAAHAAVEAAVAPTDGLLPFVHPPPFLLFVAPFGLLDYGPAFAAWVLVTGGLYFLASRRFDYFAHPSAVFTGLLGQSAFLTTAIFIAGFRFLATRPWLAGAILGCLVIKPQLGILLPVALVAGREYKAIGGAAASSLGLILLSLAAFGPNMFVAFADAAAYFSSHLADGEWPWNQLASVYALARYLGATSQWAFIAHMAVAALAIMLCWRSWRSGHSDKVAILAAATVLIPPYIFSYDYLLLILPTHALLVRHVKAGLLVGVLSALPLLILLQIDAGPNTLPLAAIICLIALTWPSFPPQESGSSQRI